MNGKPLDMELDDNDDVGSVKAFIAAKYDRIFKATGQGFKDINLLYKGERLHKDQEFKDLEPALVTIHIKGEFKGGGKKAWVEEEEAQDLLDANLLAWGGMSATMRYRSLIRVLSSRR